MKALRPEDRALFDAGREALGPSEGDRARIGKALGIAAGVTATAAATTTAAAGAGAAAGGGAGAGIAAGGMLAAKWIAVAVVVAGVGAGGIAVRARVRSAEAGESAPGVASVNSVNRAPIETASRASAARADVADVKTAPAVAVNAASEVPSSVPLAGVPSGLGSRASAASAVRAGPVTSAAPSGAMQTGIAAAPPPAQSSVSVAEEARLLREADAALRSGDAARAAGLLADHARQFPHGVLAEERDAQRVLVLCAAGQEDDARAEASRFLRAYPESPLAGRVRLACARP